MMELYYWWDLLRVGGWMVFHDTEWSWIGTDGAREFYVHPQHSPHAGVKAGNCDSGYDFYAGQLWETPDYAVKEFFGIHDLNVNNDHIRSVHLRESLGMTFVNKKSDFDFKSRIMDWTQYEADRKKILLHFIK